MKKLMMLVGAMVASLNVSAAAVNWASGTITLQGGATAGKGDVTAYLFELTKAEYDALSADKVYDTYKGSLASADATKSSTAKGVANLSSKTTTYGQGDTAYAAILYVSKDGDYAIGNLAAYTFASSMDATVNGLASTLGGDAATGTPTPISWSSTTGGGSGGVPEPTSGLLLLVGGAMLALRRKQK